MARKLSLRAKVVIGLGLAAIAALTLGGFFTRLHGVSTESHSMSHDATDQMRGIIDPGDTMGIAAVHAMDDVVPEIPARDRGGPQVAGDYGDVITFNPDLAHHEVGIVHRAVLLVRYNASADAYDAPALGLAGVRAFVAPGLGTYDEATATYVHRDFDVELDPESAGRHDGFLTKGDNNDVADQDARALSGSNYREADKSLVYAKKLELVDLAHVGGKVSRVADKEDATTMLYVALGGAVILTVGAVVAWPRLRRSRLAGARCPGCGKRVEAGAPFCPACGRQP